MYARSSRIFKLQGKFAENLSSCVAWKFSDGCITEHSIIKLERSDFVCAAVSQYHVKNIRIMKHVSMGV